MLAEDNYKVALIRLKQCRREFSKLTAGCPDFVAAVAVDAAFNDLVNELRQFAACQYGIGVKRREGRNAASHRRS